MAVYVDPLFATKSRRGWRYRQACHMTADTSLELDDMAERLGLRPEWKQHPLTCREHYDLTASKRAQALEHGARETTVREVTERRLRCQTT